MISGMLENIRRKRPMIHCITNYVTANDCANLLLAAGASPIMAEDPDEVEEIVGLCSGVVINMGTPNPRRLKAMHLAGRRANKLGIPVILDPVGAAASTMRLREALGLMEEIRFSAIRANISEICALAGVEQRGGSLDAAPDDECEAFASYAKGMAQQARCTVIMTGRTDFVTDGEDSFMIHNGHEMMRLVTGAGCQLSALTGAFAAANPKQILAASMAATCTMGICGETAAKLMGATEGNASFRNRMIDAMCLLEEGRIKERAMYEKC